MNSKLRLDTYLINEDKYKADLVKEVGFIYKAIIREKHKLCFAEIERDLL